MTVLPKPEPRKRVTARRYRQDIATRGRVRAQVIARDQCRCRVCGVVVSFSGAHVHEVVFRSQGGNPLDPAQCVTTCPRCHREVHDHHLRLALLPDGTLEMGPWTDKPSLTK